MRAEDFDKASIEELQSKANKCFDAAPSALDEPPHFLGDDERLQLMLEAQFYLAAVARKRDEATADRDFKLEVAVIVLIGLEILLSVFGIWLGFREGTQQAIVLSNIADSTHDSVDAMKELRKEQAESLAAMNDTFGDAVKAMRDQLAILQAEQKTNLKEQAKHPSFKLCIKTVHGGCPVVDTSNSYFYSEQYPPGPKISAIFELENTGNKDATNVKLRLMTEAEYTLDCEGSVERIPKPVESGRTIIEVNLGTIQVNDRMSVRCSASKPYTTDRVTFYLSAKADQSNSATYFPSIVVASIRRGD